MLRSAVPAMRTRVCSPSSDGTLAVPARCHSHARAIAESAVRRPDRRRLSVLVAGDLAGALAALRTGGARVFLHLRAHMGLLADRKPLMTLIIIVVVVLLLFGGGFGYYNGRSNNYWGAGP